MATESVSKLTRTLSTKQTAGVGVTDLARAILAPLASLKLTVFLLVVAVIVTFIGTLEQTRQDIDTVKHRYFLENSIFVEVPFQTFFVPAWFPNNQNVPGSFFIPSGMTILTIMILNLAAAHVLRFRLQASGVKLMLGLVAAIIAALVTWAIIFNSQNPNGLQGEPPIPWQSMWIILQIVTLGIACAASFGFFTIERSRKVERGLLALAAMAFGGLLVIALWLGADAFIGDSAMRIVWQLTQAGIAAAVSLVACLLLFKRKAGIVLLHLGIVGLMANELFVNATNEEQRMTIEEGETASQAIDIRSTELAIIDTSDAEFDEIIAIPQRKLVTDQTIVDEQLPFHVKVVQFLKNSDIRPVQDPSRNLATQGIGIRNEAFAIPPANGTDMDQVADFASAYVELTDKGTSKSLGTYLVSQLVDVSRTDTVNVQGKPYRISLRFKTEYKPISMKLLDVEAEYYLATETPRNFSSQVVLSDSVNGATFEKKIWMNNPLRFAGETFYQTSYGRKPSGKEYTVLQVVKNRGWMIPYVCCMFTVIGLTVQFGSSLLGYLANRQQSLERVRDSKISAGLAHAGFGMGELSQGTPWSWQTWLPSVIIVGFFVLYVGVELFKAQTGIVRKDAMRLDLLGQIPITQGGRVQPLDSFARHTALQLSKRETVKNRNESNQPAIRWLADSIFQADGYDEYRLFRIEDPEVLTALDLPYPMPTPARFKHSNLRYTLKEVLSAQAKMREIVPNPSEIDPKTWTVFQKRVGAIASKLQQVLAAGRTMGNPTAGDTNLIRRLELAGNDATSELIPLVVPTDDPQQSWISMVALENQRWLAEVAKQFQSTSTTELAVAILGQEILPSLRREIIQDRVIQRLIGDADLMALLQKQFGESNPKRLEAMIRSNWAQFPQEILATMELAEGPFVDAMLAEQRPRYEAVMAEQVARVNGGAGLITARQSELEALFLKLRPAYQNNDAETFNRTLNEYLAAVNATPPEGMTRLALSTEGWYNGFAPFYLAMVIYLAATLIGTMGWIIWPTALSRAAGGLLVLGLMVQVVGLIARVVISGRPPVTNLYSSFLFVSAVFVLGMLVLERLAKLRVGYVLAGLGGFLALMAAWNMSLTDGDTFAVLVAVLDTQFWLATHVVCISIGYGATLMAGFLGLAYVAEGLFTRVLTKKHRREFANVIYGVICFGLVTSFFGTVLGGLWADDSWGRFWGWDPKENGALMIVLWNAVSLHARWGGLIRERGLATLAIIGNLVTLWSWKGVNAMGVGLHAYAGTEDATMVYILWFGLISFIMLAAALIPTRYWASYAQDAQLPVS